MLRQVSETQPKTPMVNIIHLMYVKFIHLFHPSMHPVSKEKSFLMLKYYLYLNSLTNICRGFCFVKL